MLSNFFFCFISMNLFFLWYRHLSLVACVLDSSLIWTSRILNFECLFWFFLPQLPAENNNKYSIFKIQNLTSPNQWACCYNMKKEAKTFKSATIEPRKALTNYQVQNGRVQNSLLSSLLCSAIDWFKLWINQWHYIHKREKVMNSAHDQYGPDSLPLL